MTRRLSVFLVIGFGVAAGGLAARSFQEPPREPSVPGLLSAAPRDAEPFGVVRARPIAASALLGVEQAIGDDESGFGFIVDVACVADRVVVLDWQPLEGTNQVIVVDPVTGLATASAGPPGQGPGDLLRPSSVHALGDGSARFWVTDYQARRSVLYDLTDMANGIRDSVELDGAPFQAAWRGDSLFGTRLSATEVLHRYQRDGGVARVVQEIGEPLFATEGDAATVGFLNRNMFALHPERDLIAVAFRTLDQIHIYDFEGHLLVRVSGPEEVTDPKWERGEGTAIRMADDGRWAYLGVRGTPEFILALFSGDVGPGPVGSAIHVYSWNGELVAKWELAVGVVRFAADAATRTIWGATLDPYSQLVRFSPWPSPAMGAASHRAEEH